MSNQKSSEIENPAIYAALDAAAVDSETWHLGRSAYMAASQLMELESETGVGYETAHIQVGLMERARRGPIESSQDAISTDSTRNIYAVFDGMGGGGGNPKAAALAGSRGAVGALGREVDLMMSGAYSDNVMLLALRRSFDAANESVLRNGEGGGTVGTLAHIFKHDGKNIAAVAHCGDTRMFVYTRRRNSFRSITEDQSRGNLVYNSMPRQHGDPNNQFLLIELEEGDRIMICSDGITGDWPEQRLSNSEFIDAFTRGDINSCARAFMSYSKKEDDKSVLVLEVG